MADKSDNNIPFEKSVLQCRNNVAVAPPLIQSGNIVQVGIGHEIRAASSKLDEIEYSAMVPS